VKHPDHFLATVGFGGKLGVNVIMLQLILEADLLN